MGWGGHPARAVSVRRRRRPADGERLLLSRRLRYGTSIFAGFLHKVEPLNREHGWSQGGAILELKYGYLIYMVALVVFCTMAINIYAGQQPAASSTHTPTHTFSSPASSWRPTRGLYQDRSSAWVLVAWPGSLPRWSSS